MRALCSLSVQAITPCGEPRSKLHLCCRLQHHRRLRLGSNRTCSWICSVSHHQLEHHRCQPSTKVLSCITSFEVWLGHCCCWRSGPSQLAASLPSRACYHSHLLLRVATAMNFLEKTFCSCICNFMHAMGSEQICQLAVFFCSWTRAQVYLAHVNALHSFLCMQQSHYVPVH